MKKTFIILTVLLGLLTTTTEAQTFITSNTATGDSSIQQMTTTGNVYNNIKGTTSPVRLRWNVANHSANLSEAGTEWGIDGICDNVTCYAGQLLLGTMRRTDVYDNLSFGIFYVILNPTNAPMNSTAWVQVTATDTTTGGSTRTLTFIATKTTTGVLQLSADDNIHIFPNPASENVIVSLGDNYAARTISIYSADGKLVKHQEATERVSTISLTELAHGRYFIHLKDGNGTTIANRALMHN